MKSDKPVPDWLKDKMEKTAAAKLDSAKKLLARGDVAKAKIQFKEITRDYPGTAAAREAQELDHKR